MNKPLPSWLIFLIAMFGCSLVGGIFWKIVVGTIIWTVLSYYNDSRVQLKGKHSGDNNGSK